MKIVRVAPMQVILADLGLILFLATAVGLVSVRSDGAALTEPVFAESQLTYRPDIAGVSFADWLTGSAFDQRAQITIYATYSDGPREIVNGQLDRLISDAKSAGRKPRVIIQYGQRDDVYVVAAYDQIALPN